MEASKQLGYKVFMCSDLHIGHKNVVLHCPERVKAGGFDPSDLAAHDKWILDKWNATVGKKDIVYILGDFTFMSAEQAKSYLGKMNGRKFLILGNHDKSIDKLTGCFEQITQMKSVTFKKEHWNFLEEDFHCFLIHYRMTVWPSKHYGCVNVHGHSHGKLDDYNDQSSDLCVDVGWDSRLGNYNLVDLEKLYKHFKEKTGGKSFHCYALEMKEQNMLI